MRSRRTFRELENRLDLRFSILYLTLHYVKYGESVLNGMSPPSTFEVLGKVICSSKYDVLVLEDRASVMTCDRNN